MWFSVKGGEQGSNNHSVKLSFSNLSFRHPVGGTASPSLAGFQGVGVARAGAKFGGALSGRGTC